MKRQLAATILASILLGSGAIAQTTINPTPPGQVAPVPPNSTSSTTKSIPMTPPEKFTVTNYYNQDVYDPNDNKIGSIEDVLIDKNGQITDLIIGVGGFLG